MKFPWPANSCKGYIIFIDLGVIGPDNVYQFYCRYHEFVGLRTKMPHRMRIVFSPNELWASQGIFKCNKCGTEYHVIICEDDRHAVNASQ